MDNTDHVNQFSDMHDIGDALLFDGFAEPVMEAEVLTVTYNSVDEIMRDLKAIGANVTAQHSRTGLGGKTVLRNLRKNYEQFSQDGLLPASYEIIYGHAWKPALAEAQKQETKQQFVDFQL